jgi:tetratricopeptide (TPR) repeat protein
MADIWLGRPEDAASEIERLVSESPTEVRYQLGHARLLLSMGRYTSALELLHRLCADRPEIVDAWLLRAQAARNLLRVEEASDSARKAFQLLPDAPLTLYWMHFPAWTEERDPQKAHDYLRQAIAVHPRCVPAHVALGNLYLHAERPSN